MSQQQHQNSQGIFEQYIVLGIDTQKLGYEKIINNEIETKILDLFPGDYNDDYESVPEYLKGLDLWCFPNGLKIFDSNLNQLNKDQNQENEERFFFKNLHYIDPIQNTQYSNIYKKMNDIHEKDLIFQFITTDENYTKRYCTCLHIYEKYFLSSSSNSKNNNNNNQNQNNKAYSKCLPKLQIQKILKNPLELDKDTDMIYIPKSICLISPFPFFEPQRQILTYIYHNVIIPKSNHNMRKSLPIPSKLIDIFNNLILCYNDIEKAEQHWETNWPEIQKGLYDKGPKKYMCVKETHMLEFYISYFFSRTSIFNTPDNNKTNSNTNIKVYFPDTSNKMQSEIFGYKISERVSITEQNFSYRCMYKKLTLLNIIKIIKYILLERQIIFFSKNPGEISQVTEALLSFISPLTWSSVYIPFLPIQTWEQISAPMAYIIGFSSVYKNFIIEEIQKLFPQDRNRIIIVDLDKTIESEQIIVDEDDAYRFPEGPKNYLIQNMTKVLQDFKQSQSGDPNKEWSLAILKSQKYFGNMMLQLINNYPIFFKPNSQFMQQQQNNPQMVLCAEKIFDFQMYTEMFPEKDQPFIQEFNQTMMFCKFIEDSYEGFIQTQDKSQKLSKEIQEYLDYLNIFPQYNQNRTITSDILQDQDSQELNENYYIQFQSPQNNSTNKNTNNKENNNSQIYQQQLDELQNFHIQQAIQKQLNPQYVSILPDLIKWLKFLENYKLDNLKSDKSQQEDQNHQKIRKFYQDHLDHNILYFLDNKEQKILNQDRLTRDSELLPKLNKRKIVDLRQVFSQKFDDFFNLSNKYFSTQQLQSMKKIQKNNKETLFQSPDPHLIQNQKSQNNQNQNLYFQKNCTPFSYSHQIHTDESPSWMLPALVHGKIDEQNQLKINNNLIDQKYNFFLKRNRNLLQNPYNNNIKHPRRSLNYFRRKNSEQNHKSVSQQDLDSILLNTASNQKKSQNNNNFFNFNSQQQQQTNNNFQDKNVSDFNDIYINQQNSNKKSILLTTQKSQDPSQFQTYQQQQQENTNIKINNNSINQSNFLQSGSVMNKRVIHGSLYKSASSTNINNNGNIQNQNRNNPDFSIIKQLFQDIQQEQQQQNQQEKQK